MISDIFISLRKGKEHTVACRQRLKITKKVEKVETAMTQMPRLSLKTTGIHGLRHDIFPMRLYHKAKKLGIWNPCDIDFSQDMLDWQRLNEKEKQYIIMLTAIFQGAEECVTLDLLPLVLVIAQEGHLEEEMFLTTF